MTFIYDSVEICDYNSISLEKINMQRGNKRWKTKYNAIIIMMIIISFEDVPPLDNAEKLQYDTTDSFPNRFCNQQSAIPSSRKILKIWTLRPTPVSVHLVPLGICVLYLKTGWHLFMYGAEIWLHDISVFKTEHAFPISGNELRCVDF